MYVWVSPASLETFKGREGIERLLIVKERVEDEFEEGEMVP